MLCISIMYWMAGEPGELADADVFDPVAVVAAAVAVVAVGSTPPALVVVRPVVVVRSHHQLRERLHKNTKRCQRQANDNRFEYICHGWLQLFCGTFQLQCICVVCVCSRVNDA